jgi:hypothetical protein
MTVVGVLGGQWRATVTPWGAIDPWDGSPRLDWCIAADDRWHRPEREAAVRQTRVDGTPVLETRVRIPDGDAVQRIWSVPDAGGLTLVEVENRSPLPIAVAFTRSDLGSERPPTQVPLQGIDLPATTVTFPVGHHASVVVALAHHGSGAGALPTGLPGADAVARGWVATAHRASRFVVPDPLVVDAVVGTMCELMLTGPVTADDDPVGFLLGVGQLVRMGEAPGPWVADVAAAVESAVTATPIDPLVGWGLDAASAVLAVAGERRALADLDRVRAHLGPAVPRNGPAANPRDGGGVRDVARLERTVVGFDGAVLPGGFPPTWLGADVEAHGIPAGPSSRLSLAVRWHGARPAVLWEVTGPSVVLTAPVVAPGWRVEAPSGEALWPAPERVVAVGADEAGSFS